MANEFTPGPWVSKPGIGRWNVTTTDKPRTLNICSVSPDRVEQEANARLIAAAPDMLASLIAVTNYMRLYGMTEDEQKIHDDARAAISKATKG